MSLNNQIKVQENQLCVLYIYMYYNTGEAEIDCNMLRSTTCDTSIATFCLVYNHRPDENTLGIQRNAIPLLTFVYITLCPMLQNLGSDQKRNVPYFLIVIPSVSQKSIPSAVAYYYCAWYNFLCNRH